MCWKVSNVHHVLVAYKYLFFPQSWWIWADSEITDLWYNCFHDNATDSWLCAATTESGNSSDVISCQNVKQTGNTCVILSSQTGSSQFRPSWSSQWSSLLSHSWFFWVSCSLWPERASSTSQLCVRPSQVTRTTSLYCWQLWLGIANHFQNRLNSIQTF